jgi:hypothetical protein
VRSGAFVLLTIQLVWTDYVIGCALRRHQHHFFRVRQHGPTWHAFLFVWNRTYQLSLRSGLIVQPGLGSLLHHWCASCIKRGELLREAAAWLGASSWIQRNGFLETPLHSLCANPDIDVSVLQEVAGVIPPAAWRMRGREGSPLHALCKQSAVSGTMLKVVTESWQNDDYVALLQTDSLGRTPIELLCQACHDVGSSVARQLPVVAKNGLRRELDYVDYHRGGLDGLSVLSQMAARGAVVAESTRTAVRHEMLQEMVRCMVILVACSSCAAG